MGVEIEQVCAAKEEAIAQQRFEDAAQHRDKEKRLRAQREEKLEDWKRTREETRVVVDVEDMMQVVSGWTGIPLSRMEQKESEKLLNLEKELQTRVIGQNEATIAISKALRRSRADLKDPRRPIGSFLFMGPTGVGKTHLAKILAETMFGDQESMVAIDMSEYMEKFSVSRMIGSPPGYVGYEEGGQLTEAVRRKPYCVVLFDEIEKANQDVVQLLLQVLEDGRLTDSLGRTVDFRNTIIIMTSNVGAHILQKGSVLGFGEQDNDAGFEALKSRITDEARKVFKPEFLNRINTMVVFRQLLKPDLEKIIDLEVAKLAKRLRSRDIDLHVDLSVKDHIIEKGYDEKYGARPLRRAVEQYLEDPLAEAILRGDVERGKPINVVFEDGIVVFKQDQPASSRP
jgi:ATP-dependent Clp protease ATP-binding subunit ClpC